MSRLSATIQQFIANPPHEYNPHHDDNPEELLIHPSMAMQCARKIYYQMHAKTEEKTVSMPMVAGTLFHAYVSANVGTDWKESWGWNSTEDLQHIYTNVPIDLRPTWPMIGLADIMNDEETLDMKTISGTGLYYRKREGKAAIGHIIQSVIYSWALNRPYAGVLYISRDKFDTLYYRYEVAKYWEKALQELERLAFLRKFTFRPKRELADGRELDPFTDWECHYCPFKSKCLRGEN